MNRRKNLGKDTFRSPKRIFSPVDTRMGLLVPNQRTKLWRICKTVLRVSLWQSFGSRHNRGFKSEKRFRVFSRSVSRLDVFPVLVKVAELLLRILLVTFWVLCLKFLCVLCRLVLKYGANFVFLLSQFCGIICACWTWIEMPILSIKTESTGNFVCCLFSGKLPVLLVYVPWILDQLNCL